MTPLTLSRSSTIAPLETDNPATLAGLPLSFTLQRQCKNKETMASIVDVLSDKSSSDQSTVAIFKNAFMHTYCAELNQIIKNINAVHGTGTVAVNANVVAMVADQGIDLIQNTDGSVQMCRPIITRSSPDIQEAIRLGADPALGDDVQRLICSYDDEIVICPKNKNEILSILSSDDVIAKNLLFAAASHQHKIPCLNALLSAKKITLDLSGADLSNLDLTDLILINADLSHANLRGATLIKTVLYGSDLRYADLTNANLTKADLSGGVNLQGAYLDHANLKSANLQGANLTNASLTKAMMRLTKLNQATSPTPD